MVKVWDGSKEVDGTPTYWNGEEEFQATVSAMPYGYQSVTAMLAAKPFFVAHRGGSVDWPEMSLRGMTESVSRGVGCLEVSLARTTDGVWFGMHDETFARTAGLATAPKGSEVTWAQVQTYKNGNDRYYTLQELVKPWAKTHTFFIDPKYQHTRMAELVPLLNSLVEPSRVVIKYFGDNTRLAGEAKAAGYKSWGYFYAGDFDNGMFDRCKGAWDFLGISYDAAQTYWTRILAEGKPVLGHIAPTAAAVTMALNKGASGVMVSGVKSQFGAAGL